MRLLISGSLLEQLKKITASKIYDFANDGARWGDTITIDIGRFAMDKVKQLRDLIEQCKGAYGAKAHLRDIDVWLEAGEKGATGIVCKNSRQFQSLFQEEMTTRNRKYMYMKYKNVWMQMYCSSTKFSPKQRDSKARADVTFVYRELGSLQDRTFTFYDDHCNGKTVAQIVNNAGLYYETDELRAEHDQLVEKYFKIYNKVGLQMLAVGTATDNLDGNKKEEHDWYGSREINMILDGKPSKVVIDVVSEKGEKIRDNSRFDPDFWKAPTMMGVKTSKEAEEIEEQAEEAETQHIEIPIFPIVPVFSLSTHTRLRIHVVNLTKYEYDSSLFDKLVLPNDVRDLVTLLLSENVEFRDIVQGKSGGNIILCAGPPGCGKTLTSEVYAETMQRPLYSVQCSQLGTNEEELEREILRAFNRAQRWNAILLLDEADVYVAARGNDIQQNAIVGVFLRVMEYYSGVLFMTTNRSDLVDDAVTSRCLARIDYGIPTPEDQAKIWKILSHGSGFTITDETIQLIVSKFPKLSGRDVKQLVKLSSRVASARGLKELDFNTIVFVKKFKPTPGDGRMKVEAD